MSLEDWSEERTGVSATVDGVVATIVTTVPAWTPVVPGKKRPRQHPGPQIVHGDGLVGVCRCGPS